MIIIVGLLLMFLLLYHVFGATHDGIYAIARVKSLQQVESEDADSNEKTFAVKPDFLAGPHAGKTMDAEHFETPGSAYNLDLKQGETILAVAEQQEDQLIIGVDEHFKSHYAQSLAT